MVFYKYPKKRIKHLINFFFLNLFLLSFYPVIIIVCPYLSTRSSLLDLFGIPLKILFSFELLLLLLVLTNEIENLFGQEKATFWQKRSLAFLVASTWLVTAFMRPLPVLDSVSECRFATTAEKIVPISYGTQAECTSIMNMNKCNEINRDFSLALSFSNSLSQTFENFVAALIYSCGKSQKRISSLNFYFTMFRKRNFYPYCINIRFCENQIVGQVWIVSKFCNF